MNTDGWLVMDTAPGVHLWPSVFIRGFGSTRTTAL